LINTQISTNFNELMRDFNGMEEELLTQLEEELNEAGQMVAIQAKLLAPVDTGRLRRSITWRNERTNDGPVVHIGTTVEYAKFVEFGTGVFTPGGRQTPWTFRNLDGQYITTRGQKPQPFLEPAFDEKKREIERRIGRMLERVLNRG